MSHAGPALAEGSQAGIGRWTQFLTAFETLVVSTQDEGILLGEGEVLLRELIAHDDWLPEAFAAPDAMHYRQYPLHCDLAGRFSVVSFVWNPGQTTPIHDHQIWGLVGVLRGSEMSQRFETSAAGPMVACGPQTLRRAGEIEVLSPTIGDIHKVENVGDAIAVGIHVYGGDIGAIRRRAFAPDGTQSEFISSFTEVEPPMAWYAAAG